MNELTLKDDLIKEIQKATEEVPFGNSEFQNTFMSACQETPARKYRHVLLQMSQKINALQDARFRRKRTEIDIEELESKIKTSEGFEKRRLEIDLEEKQWGMTSCNNLIRDAIVELNTFYKIYSELPKVNREEFEAKEKEYWSLRFINEAQLALASNGRIDLGLAQSLHQIGMNPLAVQEELKLINFDATRDLHQNLLTQMKIRNDSSNK